MQKTILTTLLSLTLFVLSAQKPHWLSTLYVNVETSPAQMRFFRNKITSAENQKGGQWAPTIATWEWYGGIGVRINSILNIEVGYYQRTYYNGANHFNIPKCEDNFGSWTSQDSDVKHYYLRFYYQALKGKFFRKPIHFYTGLGYAYAVSPGPSSFRIDFGGQCFNDPSKYYYNYHYRSIDAIQPTYHLLEASLKMEYQIFKHLGLTFSTNYNQGFKTIGIFKMDYGIVGGGYKGYFESETKGTNFEFCFGAKLYPFANLEQKPKKRKKKIIQQGRFRD
jgi:hypothetical protein